MFSLGHTKFLVEINYKSGIQKRYWCYSFSKNADGINHWAVNNNRPIALWCADTLEDSIESIWTVKARRGLLGIKK